MSLTENNFAFTPNPDKRILDLLDRFMCKLEVLEGEFGLTQPQFLRLAQIAVTQRQMDTIGIRPALWYSDRISDLMRGSWVKSNLTSFIESYRA